MMPEAWRQTFLLHAETAEYRRRVRDATARIGAALDRAHQPYVAWSGGKDSGAMLALVLDQAPAVPVVHGDYGRALVPAVVYAEIEAMAGRFGIRDLRVHPHDPAPKASLRRLQVQGFDLVFVGIRAEEAIHRRHRIQAGRAFGPIPECWPVQDWTWRDVWALHVARDLPYLSLYDERAALIGYDRARFKTLFDPAFAHLGTEALDGVLHWRARGPD